MKKYLIVGLGNVGEAYENTRHNIGFKVLDFFSKKEGFIFQSQKLGATSRYKLKGRTLFFLKPNTYMNLSGKSVAFWLTKEKIPLENCLIITDDLNLSFGSFRLKTKGTHGGHNGLKDIQEQLNTTQYNRFRFGIGAMFTKGKQTDYVLGDWTDDEKIQLEERLQKSVELIQSFVLLGVNHTMTIFNGK